MNWKLIFQLSLFGLAMAIATVSWIPSNIELLFWLVILLVCAYLIAKRCSGKYFLHGFMVSIFNSVWMTAIHVTLFDTYMANHPEAAQMSASLPMSPRLGMVIMGPIIGALFGVVLGVFTLVAAKLLKKNQATA